MRKILFLSLFLGVLMVVAPVWAQIDEDLPDLPIFAEEKIASFDVMVTINKDASIDVTEKIVYDFGDYERHGIFRDIPIKYDARGGNYGLRISGVKVTDENGQKLTTDISYPSQNIEIKIGDADTLITGKHTYVISYKIKRAINYFDDHDELYWNATGTDWDVSIDKASATIYFPNAITEKEAQATCYAGTWGSTESCADSLFLFNADDQVEGVVFNQRDLSVYNGLTVVAGWPVGQVYKPTVIDNFINILIDNWILFIPVLVFVLLFARWFSTGRDALGRETIIPEYEAPENLNPAQVGTIIDQKVDRRDISALIIDLAVRGYLKIKKLDGDYELIKLKSEDDLAVESEKDLMKGFFSGANTTKKLSELKDKFYKTYQDISNGLYESLYKSGYFYSNPGYQRGLYLVLGILILFAAFFIGSFLGGIGVFSLILSGLLFIIFGQIMPARTRKGVLAKEYILGLKMYLSVAEKDRINFHNAPAKNPEQFEKLLPYAMVMGVEKEWAKQFEDIYNQKPDWYDAPAGQNFNSLMFINSLHSFQSKAGSTLTSQPSSSGASGGHSGFSGGGFSGGGFGGGGGGSW